jgi:hypothetical protein
MEREQRISPELIRQARQTDLAEYLIRKGEPIIRSGQRHRHKEHDSLVFTDGSYYWNSMSDTGNSVDFLVKHRGMDFISAVLDLTMTVPEGSGEQSPSPQRVEQFSFADIKLKLNMGRTIAYLNQTRGIDYTFIKNLIHEKMIYQEATKNNIVFPMYDESGKVVGAELQGTLTDPDKRFKGIQPGSKYGYGYSVNPCRSGKIKYVFFFESAVDLLSFWDIERQKDRSLDYHLLVSMSGVKENIVKHTLNRLQQQPVQPLFPLKCFLSVDNDSAGSEFIEKIKAQIENVELFMPDPQFKDWNDQLKAMKGLGS